MTSRKTRAGSGGLQEESGRMVMAVVVLGNAVGLAANAAAAVRRSIDASTAW